MGEIVKTHVHMTDSFQEQFAHILELQQIDLNLHKMQNVLDGIPARLADLLATYTVAKEALEGAQKELADVEKAKREDEAAVADSTEHLRNREAKLYAIKTQKEYQAALKEVSDGRRMNREREDRILASMEKIEGLTQKITQLSEGFADKESAYRTKDEELKKEEVAIRAEMEKELSFRPELIAKIDKILIRKYDFVRRRYENAVVAVIGGVCHGCSTKVPPQLYNEMLRRNEFKVCPNCQRLIYVAHEPETKEAGPAEVN